MENEEKLPPVFSPWLFWDSDLAKMDFQRDASYVIRRVFDIGKLEDVAEAMRYYPEELLKKTLIEATYLPENAIYLSSALFKLNIEDLKCSTSKQFHPLF